MSSSFTNLKSELSFLGLDATIIQTEINVPQNSKKHIFIERVESTYTDKQKQTKKKTHKQNTHKTQDWVTQGVICWVGQRVGGMTDDRPYQTPLSDGLIRLPLCKARKDKRDYR